MASDQFGSGGGFSGMIDRTNATWQEDVVKAYLASATLPANKTDFVSTVRIGGGSILALMEVLRFRPLICTYAPCGPSVYV